MKLPIFFMKTIRAIKYNYRTLPEEVAGNTRFNTMFMIILSILQ